LELLADEGELEDFQPKPAVGDKGGARKQEKNKGLKVKSPRNVSINRQEVVKKKKPNCLPRLLRREARQKKKISSKAVLSRRTSTSLRQKVVGGGGGVWGVGKLWPLSLAPQENPSLQKDGRA